MHCLIPLRRDGTTTLLGRHISGATICLLKGCIDHTFRSATAAQDDGLKTMSRCPVKDQMQRYAM